jgi:hypothetical protein
MTYDLSNMQTIETEVSLSQRLHELHWSKTEQLFSCNLYFSGRGKTSKLIGITAFHPDLGPCECTHYVLRR